MKTGKGMKKPNPGSKEAVKRGCTCAQLDNNYGKGARGKPNLFWVSADCPLHGTNTKRLFVTN